MDTKDIINNLNRKSPNEFKIHLELLLEQGKKSTISEIVRAVNQSIKPGYTGPIIKLSHYETLAEFLKSLPPASRQQTSTQPDNKSTGSTSNNTSKTNFFKEAPADLNEPRNNTSFFYEPGEL